MPKNKLTSLKKEVKKQATTKRAKSNAWFFKTGPGEYGYGDKFIGLTVPKCRAIAKKFMELPFADLGQLLKSKIHEERLIALFMLVKRYQEGDNKEQAKIYKFYLANTKHINNWDLVDSSAHYIVGSHLGINVPRGSKATLRGRGILKKLAKSKSLWERRIAIISTAHFINNCDFKDTIEIAKILLKDEHDLIHKAVGWMLREVGKKDLKTLEKFLNKHYANMPRTMLRYAIERLPEHKRLHYLKK